MSHHLLPAHRLATTRLLPTALLLALTTCVGDAGTGPGADAMVSLPIQPAIIEGPADGTALPINRIRVVVRAHSVDADGAAVAGEILAEERFDVDPASTSWEIDVRVPLRPGQVEVVVAHFSLIHAAAGTELVEFSGITPPIRIEQGASVEPAELDLVRGPLSNLFVTGVSIIDAPTVLALGTSAPLEAEVSTSGQEAPSVFWVSEAPDVAVAADGIVTAVAPGTTRIIAAAGAHADTVALEVVAATGTPGAITVTDSTAVGSGLQSFYSFDLGVPEHGGTTVTVTSLDPGLLLVAPSTEDPGAASVEIAVPNLAQSYFFSPAAVEGTTGTARVVLEAPGFTPDTALIDVVQPVVALFNVATPVTWLSGPQQVLAYVGVELPDQSGIESQAVRAGGAPVSVTLSSVDPAVVAPTTALGSGASVSAEIAAGAFTTPSGTENGGFALAPVEPGTTTVDVAAEGFRNYTQPWSVTVEDPQLALSALTQVPGGLQTIGYVNLGNAPAHGSATVTVASADPQRMLVARDSLGQGFGTLDLSIPDGETVAPFWIQIAPGAQLGTVSIDASEPRFVPASLTLDVVSSVVVLDGLATSYTADQPDVPFRAAVGQDIGGIFVEGLVNPLTGTVLVNVESTDPGVVALTTNQAMTARAVSVPIPVGEAYSPDLLVDGGVFLEIVGAGTATVSVNAQGFGLVQGLSSITITVSP